MIAHRFAVLAAAVAIAGVVTTSTVTATSGTYTISDLGTLGGTYSIAFGINARDQVVGEANTADGAIHAFRTAPNSPINPATDDLGTFGGTYSQAIGINVRGQVVGVADTANNATGHAFRTAPNSPINPATDDLGTLGDTSSIAVSVARDINARGQVVGYSTTANGARHAFLCDGGVMTDLNTLLPSGSGWILVVAAAINDAGQIVGDGQINGQTHAFLLTPRGGS